MKKRLLLSFVTSLLVTLQANSLNLYSDKDKQSNIITNIDTTKGTIVKKHCMSNRKSQEWCKVDYFYKELKLQGYIPKDALDAMRVVRKEKPTFSSHFGGRYDDSLNSVVSVDGGYVLVGYTDSFGHGREDAYVIKIDTFGNKVYSKALGTGDDESLNGVVAFEDSFLVAGSSGGVGNDVESIYMAKFSHAGKLLWEKGFYSDEDDYYRANDIIKISPNNTIVVGYEEHVKFFNSEVNIYVNAINSEGVRNGIKRYGGAKVDRANSIVNVSDGYVIAGLTRSWGAGGEDAYVLKIDKKGQRVWHNVFGYEYDEVANQIIATQDGGYILVGTTDSDIKKQKEIYVVKLNALGQREWQRHYGSKEDEEGFSIVEVEDGYVIAGYTKDTTSYSKDALLVKIAKNGAVLWSKHYGLEKDDAFKKIIKSGEYFVAVGYTTSLENYSKEAYVVKVDKDGNL